MTSREVLEREAILRNYITALPHAALLRIVSAERWGGRDTKICLVAHAEPKQARDPRVIFDPVRWEVMLAFDDLCVATTAARVAAACQLLAATLLHDRETASLRALLGEEVSHA